MYVHTYILCCQIYATLSVCTCVSACLCLVLVRLLQLLRLLFSIVLLVGPVPVSQAESRFQLAAQCSHVAHRVMYAPEKHAEELLSFGLKGRMLSHEAGH